MSSLLDRPNRVIWIMSEVLRIS